MKKDIQFLCQFFYPEHNSSATLPFDTASHLASKGYKVGALCGYPREYSAQKDVPLQETKNGVDIQRLKYIQLSRVSIIGRLINYFSFTLKAWLSVRKMKDSRAVIVYSNPPVLPIVALRAKRKYGTKVIFVAYDLYPEIAHVSGTFKPGSMLDRLMKWVNTQLYSKVDMVVALTDEMRQQLLQTRPQLSPERVCTVENWAHEREVVPAEPGTAEKFGFTDDQFVVGYFGNMGTCQDMDTLMQAALLKKKDPKVGFLLVGHGNKQDGIKTFIRQHELNNVKVFDFLTGEDFTQALALVGCSVVSLEPGLKGLCAPSKYYSCLLAGHPVIVVGEPDSYLADEVHKEQIGFFVKNTDANAFCTAIDKMRADPEALEQMSRSAKELYRRRYDHSIAMEKYEAVMKKVL